MTHSDPSSRSAATERLALAERLYGTSDFQGAERCLASFVDGQSPTDQRLLYGVVLARLRRGKDAETVLRGVLESEPNLFEAITWMSIVSIMNGDLDGALSYALRAVALRPGEATGHSTLGDCYLSRRELGMAIDSFKRAISLRPTDAVTYHNLGLALGLDGRSFEAIAAYRLAIELAQDVPSNYLALSRIQARHSMVGDAIDTLLSGLGCIHDDVSLLSELASTYALGRNNRAAEQTFTRVMEISPKTRLGYANWLQAEGRFEESARLYESSIFDRVNPGQSYYGLMQVKPVRGDLSIVERMREYAAIDGLPIRERMYIHYALARAYDQLTALQKASEAYESANAHAFRIYQAGRAFKISELEKLNDTILEKFSPFAAQSLHQGALTAHGGQSKAQTPIFIVGMIRSGTTLLEQIVSSHPEVAPTGELRFWIEEGPRLASKEGSVNIDQINLLGEQYRSFVDLMAHGAPFFTDKMPLNFALLGLIRAALPNARFLHITRHPVDTCLSIWMTFFGGGPQFAYDRANIVAYYAEYERVVNRWREALPDGCMLEIDYEQLVTNREPVTRNVLEFCGLRWDEACLRHDENRSTISTPSRWQARQPLYTTSAGKWKNYEPWLGEFRALLK